MVKLTLSASLARLLLRDNEPGQARSSRTTVTLDASNWSEMTEQIRERFPALAKQILNGGTEVLPGFVVVVNDEIVRRPDPRFALSPGDEMSVFTAVAGG